MESFERQRGRVVCVSGGRCFGSDGAFQDDSHHSGTGRGDGPYCQEGHIDDGGEGEAQVSERAADEVCVDGRHIHVEDLVHGLDYGVRWFAVDWWYGGVFEALHELIGGGGRHGRGE